MPLDIRQRFKDRFQQNKEQTQLSDERTNSEKQLFLTYSTYALDLYITSGKVCFGDPITRHCDSLLSIMLKDDPEIRKQLRVYTLRSTDVNAFTTHQGVIVVSTGLIARLENEAQLAFIMAHEAAHFVKKHSAEGFEFKTDLFKSRSEHSDEDKFLASIQHSKNSEWEADEFAIEKLKNSPYSVSDVASVFTILKMAYQGVQEHDFPFASIEDSSFQLQYLLEQKNDRPDVIEFEGDEDEEPEMSPEDQRKYSSHPQIFERHEALLKAFENDTFGKYQVEVSTPQFKHIVFLAQKDALYNYILEENYLDAWVLADYLLKNADQAERSTYAECRAYALNRMLNMNYFSKAVLNKKFDKKYPPSAYQKILRKLDDSRLNALVAREVWRIYQMDTSNAILKEINASTVEKARLHFYKSVNSEDKSINGTKKRKEAEENMNKSFANAEFAGLRALLTKAPEKSASLEEEEDEEDKDGKKAEKKKKEVFKRPGIQRMLMLTPSVINFDLRKKPHVRLQKAFEMQEAIETMTAEVSADLGIELVNLQIYPNDAGAVNRYNDYAFLVDWMEYHDQDSLPSDLLIQDAQTLADHYQVDYLNTNFYFMFVKREQYKMERMMMGIIVWPTLPLYLHWQFNPQKQLMMVHSIYNLKTGELDHNMVYSRKAKFKPKEMRAYLYHSLNQIRP